MQQGLLGDDSAYVLLVVGALFVHACYQLSVSVLTYMSSHKLSQKASVRQLIKLGFSYAGGVVVTTALLLVAVASLLSSINNDTPRTAVAIVIACASLIGLLTMTLYYRQGNGTQLWLPRPIATYLLKRAKKTRRGVESAMLGATTVLGELPFLSGPLLVVGIVLVNQPPSEWLGWGIAYGLLASLPLIVITLYLTSGHSIAGVQKWREENKNFLQWTSGITLLLLTLYITILQLGAMA